MSIIALFLVAPLASAVLPDAIDWSATGIVPPVRDQGQCGDATSIAATTVVESAIANQSGTFLVLSEQELRDCAETQLGWDVLDFMQTDGICSAADYPIRSECKGACAKNTCTPVASISSIGIVPAGNETALQQAVAKGPVAALVDAGNSVFELYVSGVVDACPTRPQLDHALVIVGYGSTSDGIDYWKLQNSWGSAWGEAGFIRLARGANQCGIATAARSLTVEV